MARLELPGAGQVAVESNYAYVGHMSPPTGTSIIDISDPKHPKVVTQIDITPNLHSHKVRVQGDVMLVNHEKYRGYQGDELSRGGLKIFDISDHPHPREIAFVAAGEWGYHRFTFDGRYCYGSPTPEGYVGNIMEILDLQNPRSPRLFLTGGSQVNGLRVARRHCRMDAACSVIIPCGLATASIVRGGTTAGTFLTLVT